MNAIKSYARVLFTKHKDDESLLLSYINVYSIVVPFEFDGEKFSCPPGYKFKFWYIAIAIYSIQILRIIKVVNDLVNEGHMGFVFMMMFWLGISAQAIFLYFFVIFNNKEYCDVLNSWKQIKTAPVTDFSKVLRALFSLVTVLTTIPILLYTKDSKNPTFFCSSVLLCNENHFGIWIFFLAYEILLCYLTFGIHMVTDALLVGMCTTICSRLGPLRKSKHPSLSDLREYRVLQIFERLMNKSVAKIFFIIKMATYVIISYLMVMLIKGLADFDMVAVTFAGFQVTPPIIRIRIFLWAMSDLNSTSNSVLEYWQEPTSLHSFLIRENGGRNTTKGEILKTIKSCRPLQISASAMYGIKQSTLLSYVSSVFGNIATILIALRNKQIY